MLCAANGVGTARLLLLSATAVVARRPGQLVGAGRAAAHAPPVRACRGLLPREHRELAGPVRVADPVARVLRHLRRTRLRRRFEVEPGADGWPTGRGAPARSQPGAGRSTPRVRARPVRAAARSGSCSARTCRTSTTASSCRPCSRTRPGSPRPRSRTSSTTTRRASWRGTPSARSSRCSRRARCSPSRCRRPTAVTCSAPRAWATIPARRWSTRGG